MEPITPVFAEGIPVVEAQPSRDELFSPHERYQYQLSLHYAVQYLKYITEAYDIREADSDLLCDFINQMDGEYLEDFRARDGDEFYTMNPDIIVDELD